MNNVATLHKREGSMDDDISHEMEQDIYHITELLGENQVVLDIGAYAGIFANYVKEKSPTTTLYCLEPHPGNYDTLSTNTNSLNNVNLFNKGLAGKSGSSTLYDFGEDASACHSVFSLNNKDATPIQIKTISLDDFIDEQKLTHINFMKLDCQGSEYEILCSTPYSTLKKIDYIAMEVHHAISKTGQCLGQIPHSEAKKQQLYRHLLKTHLPLYGNLDSSCIQVWCRREIASYNLRTKYTFNRIRRIASYLIKGDSQAA